jgi:hypothetical protein
MSEHHAGADADDDGHARDHGEGGEQAAPHAPSRTQETRQSAKPGDRDKPTDRESQRHAVPAHIFRMNLLPAVSRYRVNKITRI